VRAPQIRHRHDDPGVRLRRRRVGARGPPDLGRTLRTRGPARRPARRQTAVRPTLIHRLSFVRVR